MITAVDIIKVIQQLQPTDNKCRFLISLADSWYKYGGLTERQVVAFERAVAELKEDGKI